MSKKFKVGDKVSYEDISVAYVRSFSADGKVAYISPSMRSRRTIGAFVNTLREPNV